MFKRVFTDHPRDVGETYGEHMAMASSYGFKMVGAGLACLVHAVLPCFFVKTGSATINRLHNDMVERFGRAPTDAGAHMKTPDRAVAKEA